MTSRTQCLSPSGTARALRGIVTRGGLLPGDLVAIEVAVALLEDDKPSPIEAMRAANDAVATAMRSAIRAGLYNSEEWKRIAAAVDALVDASAPVTPIRGQAHG